VDLVEPPVQAEAGFVDVPSRDVSLKGRSVHLGATARLFYNLQPAEESPADKPIFVLFNGFAAEIVRGYGTGPSTVVEGGEVTTNPSSLTAIANLIYVDPRQSELSYDVLDHGAPGPGDCASDVFNEYVDAADVLLGVLKLLDAHPALRGPVYWVGESYAGVRVQWILADLRGRWDLASYGDPTLEAAIARSAHPGSLRAGQILIEPWLVGGPHASAISAACDDAGLIADVSASVGSPCEGMSACACARAHDRSFYNYTYSVARQAQREMEAAQAMVIPERAEALLGVALASIDGLHAGERGKGFKCSVPDDTTPADDALVKLLGALPAGQSYYVPYSPLEPGKETSTPALDWQTEDFEGVAFVDNLREVRAFVTDGPRDLVVPERALAPALSAIVGAARVDASAAGHIAVTYPDGERIIQVGRYPSAGHMITMIEPEAFARDVTQWVGP